MSRRNRINVSQRTEYWPGEKRQPWWNTYKLVASGSSSGVTASSTAHTKGSWTQLIAGSSVTQECSMVILSFDSWSVNGSATPTLVDIGIGASGSEIPIIENLTVGGYTTSTTNDCEIQLAIRIPANSRISARCQSGYTSGGVGNIGTIAIDLYDDGNVGLVPGKLDTIGVSTTTSRGTAITSSNTYIEVVASTTRPYRSVVMVPSLGLTSVSGATMTLRLGAGAAGAETAYYQMLNITTTTAESMYYANTRVLNVTSAFDNRGTLTWPAGTRFAVSRTAGTQNIDVMLFGIPYP